MEQMNYKEFKKYVDKINKNIANKLKDNEEELAFYTELVKRFNDICEEKEELKKQLEKYENPKDMTLMMMWATEKVKDENEELKKQLEELEESSAKAINKQVSKGINLLNQQQEFIKYLEDNWKQTQDIWYIKILNKYNEIIGVKDKKDNN